MSVCIICFQISDHVPFTSIDSDKVKSTLKQIARDWSLEGAEERRLCYDPMIQAIINHLPLPHKVIDIRKVLFNYYFITSQMICYCYGVEGLIIKYDTGSINHEPGKLH